MCLFNFSKMLLTWPLEEGQLLLGRGAGQLLLGQLTHLRRIETAFSLGSVNHQVGGPLLGSAATPCAPRRRHDPRNLAQIRHIRTYPGDL